MFREHVLVLSKCFIINLAFVVVVITTIVVGFATIIVDFATIFVGFSLIVEDAVALVVISHFIDIIIDVATEASA